MVDTRSVLTEEGSEVALPPALSYSDKIGAGEFRERCEQIADFIQRVSGYGFAFSVLCEVPVLFLAVCAAVARMENDEPIRAIAAPFLTTAVLAFTGFFAVCGALLYFGERVRKGSKVGVICSMGVLLALIILVTVLTGMAALNWKNSAWPLAVPYMLVFTWASVGIVRLARLWQGFARV